MMKWVFAIFIIISIFFSFFTGKISELSNSILGSGKTAIELCLILAGSMAVWGGIMRIAEKSGITKKAAKIFYPLSKLLFKGINPKGKAFNAICMNITANILGLGNAATPLGIEAMQELKKEEKTNTYASRNMVMFTVINTASIQVIPATIATLRLEHNSKNPLEILPAILITSLFALIVGISMVYIFDFIGKGGNKNKNN